MIMLSIILVWYLKYAVLLLSLILEILPGKGKNRRFPSITERWMTKAIVVYREVLIYLDLLLTLQFLKRCHVSYHKVNVVKSNWISSFIQRSLGAPYNFELMDILKGWSQNRVKIFYLYIVKITLFTPSLPSIFTDQFSPTYSYDGCKQETC